MPLAKVISFTVYSVLTCSADVLTLKVILLNEPEKMQRHLLKSAYHLHDTIKPNLKEAASLSGSPADKNRPCLFMSWRPNLLLHLGLKDMGVH